MFTLAELKDTIRIPPDQFHLRLADAVGDEINRKMSNKVILNVGLVIALKDIISLGTSWLLPGDGASHTETIFRCIIFRPNVGTVLTGKIRSCAREGVHVTLGFFDDIFIPPESMQHPSRYEEAEQAWVWEYPLEEGEKHDLYMDIGEPIKFRIVREAFEECSPVNLQMVDGMPAAGVTGVPVKPQRTLPATPYRIIAAINEPGLGVLSWWDQQSAAADEDADGAADGEEQYQGDDDDDGGGACEE